MNRKASGDPDEPMEDTLPEQTTPVDLKERVAELEEELEIADRMW